MGTDVDYGKIKLNFSSVFKQLNATAKDFAEKKSGGNIVVDYGTFDAGGGNVGVAVYLMTAEGKPLEDKSKFVDVAKEYIKFSVGEDQVASVKEDKLLAITQADHAEGVGDKTTSESVNYYTRGERAILDMLFEADTPPESAKSGSASSEPASTTSAPPATPPESGSGSEKSGGTPPEGGTSPEDSDPSKGGDADKEPSKDEEGDPGNQVRGYAFTYWLTVSGKKDFLEKVKSKSKGLFGGLIADLQNLQLNWKDGTSTKIGQILNPAKWKEAFGVQDIDKDKLVSTVVEQFEHDFSGTNISTRDVSVDQQKDILTKLNRYKRLTPKLASTIKSKVPEKVYAVVIQVGDEDVKFSDYNEASIAKTMTKAFGTSERMVDLNSVSEKDVIRVANVQGDTDGGVAGSSSVSEAEADGEKGGKKGSDKKRQEMDKSIVETLNAHVKEMTTSFSDKTLSCGLEDLETYIKGHPLLKGETDVDRLRDRSSHVLYVQYRQEFSLKESDDIEGILANIFETDPGTETDKSTERDKSFADFTSAAKTALQKTAEETISKFKIDSEKQNLDIVTVQKEDKAKISVTESCASNIVCMLFEEEGVGGETSGKTGEADKEADKETGKESDKETGREADKDKDKDTEKSTDKEKTQTTPFWFFAFLPDPTRPKTNTKGGNSKGSSLGDRVDWYIIPNKHIKNIDKSDKNDQDEV